MGKLLFALKKGVLRNKMSSPEISLQVKQIN